jgi:hypothetical protein
LDDDNEYRLTNGDLEFVTNLEVASRFDVIAIASNLLAGYCHGRKTARLEEARHPQPLVYAHAIVAHALGFLNGLSSGRRPL